MNPHTPRILFDLNDRVTLMTARYILITVFGHRHFVRLMKMGDIFGH